MLAMKTLRNSASMSRCAMGTEPGICVRLHAGQPAEEHQLQIASLERGDRCGVVGDRHIAHRHVEAIAEIVRHLPVPALQFLRVLIRDRADGQRRLAGRSRRGAGITGWVPARGREDRDRGAHQGRSDGAEHLGLLSDRDGQGQLGQQRGPGFPLVPWVNEVP